MFYPHDCTREDPSQGVLDDSVQPAGFLLARQRDEIVRVLHKIRLGLHERLVVFEPVREPRDVALTWSFQRDIGLYPIH